MGKQMGKKIDFEKLRKKRQRTQSLKRMFALGVIMAAVAGVIILNAFLIDTAFTTRISDLVGSFGGSGYPVAVPGGIIRDVQSMGGYLAILNDTNLYIYNQKGKTVTNLQQMTENTVMVPAGSRVLTYDVGSKRYSLDARSKRILVAKETEYSILCGDLNERGEYVIATSSKQYVAQVMVYDDKGEQKFGWASADNVVANVSLSSKGDKLVVGCVNTAGGELRTICYIFDITTQTEIARVEFSDELLLDVDYTDNEAISLLTDRQYRTMSSGGTVTGSYLLEEGKLLAVERSGRELLILTQDKDSRTQQLVLVDENCKAIARKTLNERVKDIALDARKIYMLTDSGVVTTDRMLKEVNRYEQWGISDIHLLKSKLYCLNDEEIFVLGAPPPA